MVKKKVIHKIEDFCFDHGLRKRINDKIMYKGSMLELDITFFTKNNVRIDYFSLLSMRVYSYQLKFEGRVYKRNNIDDCLVKLEELLKEIENED